MRLNNFLVKAKISTYASVGESKETILEDDSKELIFEEGEFKYRDRYFGHHSFVGEEIVFENGKAIWGMNYYAKNFSSDEIYPFLQKALRQVNVEMPFRGPTLFEEGDYKYVNEIKGNVDKFYGKETIYYQGKIVYEGYYHGGLIVFK